MQVGYMRVSSADDRQSVDLQRDALLAAGVDEHHLFVDKASVCRTFKVARSTLLDTLQRVGWTAPGQGLIECRAAPS